MDMNEQDIKNLHEKILNLIQERKLKKALKELESFMGSQSNWTLQNRLEKAQNAYSNMLKYMQQGAEDPQRPKLYADLIRDCYELADQIYMNRLDEVSNTYYQNQHKKHKNRVLGVDLCDWLRRLEGFQDELAVCQLMPEDEKSLKEVLMKHEITNKNLFMAIWSNTAWSQEEILNAKQFLASKEISSNDLSYFISAITLSLLECFDYAKLAFLLTAVTLADVQASQRALVGIVLTLLRYPQRLSVYPDLQERIDLLDEKWNLGARLQTIYLQLLRAQETERINKHIQEEIIPEMKKQAEKFKDNKFNMELTEENDFNPDWEKEFNNSKLNEKLYHLGELQMEGMDVNLSSFSPLKKYPFFFEPANWLLPFDMQHSSIAHLWPAKSENFNLAQMMVKSPLLCNNDKYSLCFLFSSISTDQRQMTMNAINQDELKDLMEEGNEISELKEYANKPDQISLLYIQDLYRFYNLSPCKHEMRNPFKQPINLHLIPALKQILNKPDYLKEVANYRFHKEQYIEALDIYQLLIEQKAADADIFQKYGFCYQKLKYYEQAIDAFRKADILKPDNLWNLRHLATCYRMTQQPDKALECYRKVEEMQPENKTVLYQIGICLAGLNQYDQAMQVFFKLDYLENNNLKAWRAIGWFSLVNGKIEQAKKYFQKVLNAQPTASDYLNAGHVAWIEKQLETAVSYYKKSVALCDNEDDFLLLFEKDKNILLQQGIAADDIPLVLDMI
ncbi:tetratricopeptide repeat protein [gut metagenome]|uniref:Tetratricopeptide repeat protein n=1 Tax=gut metagenome TaxID=749906 RepID=J9D5X8_9ZZZZ